jgi:hypothetical protein
MNGYSGPVTVLSVKTPDGKVVGIPAPCAVPPVGAEASFDGADYVVKRVRWELSAHKSMHVIVELGK